MRYNLTGLDRMSDFARYDRVLGLKPDASLEEVNLAHSECSR